MLDLVVVAVAALALPRHSAAQSGTPAPPASCAADTTYHPFDFWVGHWTVQDSTGKFLGTDDVSPVTGGCAFVELWHDADGSDGQSLFYYAPDQHRWKQVWVTANAAAPGGFKEKRLVGKRAGEWVRFQGEIVASRSVILDRTSLTSLPAARVRQVIEVSRDGGNTWLVTFDAVYVPRTSPHER